MWHLVGLSLFISSTMHGQTLIKFTWPHICDLFQNWHLRTFTRFILRNRLISHKSFSILCSDHYFDLFTKSYSFIHLVVCLTTGPKPLPKRALHTVLSRVSSFKWVNPVLSLRSSSSFLRLLPRLLVTIKLHYHQNIVLLKAKIYLRTPLRNIGKSQ